jgi:hypothetical protein
MLKHGDGMGSGSRLSNKARRGGNGAIAPNNWQELGAVCPSRAFLRCS